MKLDPFSRLRLLVLLVIFLILAGTAGYVHIEHMPLLDAVYMTVITLATVGYRELKELSPFGKIFTMGLIIVGVAVIAWALQSVTEVTVTEQLTRGIWRRRMDRMIERMRDHYIVCGHGRMGQQITRELKRQELPFVVIESNAEQIPTLESLGNPFICGNAADDTTLLAAGIKHAKGLVTVGPTDADNIFVTLTARGLNPDLYIVARSVILEDEEKLRRAGANKVLSPYVIGGLRMTAALLRPNVADFLDVVMHSEKLEFTMEEVLVAPNAAVAGRTITDVVGLLCPTGPAILGVKTSAGEMKLSPPPAYVAAPGDRLIVLGTENQIESLRQAARG